MEAEATQARPTVASYLRMLRRRAWILVLCLDSDSGGGRVLRPARGEAVPGHR